jgi:hypothetical protein
MTTRFQPPPTYALPVIADETTGRAVFNPIWLKWFIDLSAGLTTIGAGSGSVTSVAGLTIGTSGTDLSSAVANSTTTPVITLNVPTASATNRGALSAADWAIFNSKQPVAAPVTKTADFTVAATDLCIINNKATAACTITLPTASSFSGRVLYFLNHQNFSVTSNASNVIPLTGGAAGTVILDAIAGDSATLVSDGTNWLTLQYISNDSLLWG